MKKVSSLEGLRGLAAFIVVIGHLQRVFVEGIETKIVEQLSPYLSHTVSLAIAGITTPFLDGRLAVYIFWFMSAYVISIKLFTSPEEKAANYLTVSAAKRYFRLMIPCFFSVLIAYALLKSGHIYYLIVAQKLDNNILFFFNDYKPDFLFAMKSVLWDAFFDYDMRTSYNSVLWTMEKEFLGSLFCFGLFGILRKNARRYYVYAVVILLLVLSLNLWLISFVAGFILCDYDNNPAMFGRLRKIESKLFSYPKTVFVLFILFIFCSSFILKAAMVPSGFFNVIKSAIIVYVVLRLSPLQHFLQRKLFVWLGKISFSLYLIHWPMIASLGCWIYLCFSSHLTGVFVASAVTIPLSLLAAHYYCKWIDEFGVRTSNRIGSWFKKAD